MAITKLQFTTGASGALATGGSYQLAIPSTAAGSLLVLDVFPQIINQGSNSVVSLLVTDSAGSTYTAAFAPISAFSGATITELGQYYAVNVAAGITWVKVTLTSSFGGTNAFVTLGVWEFAGAATTNPLDVTISGLNPTFTQPSLHLTTTVDGDVLIFATASGAPTASAGFTIGAAGNPADEYMVQGTHGSTTVSFGNTTGSAQVPMCFTAFKAGASAAATVTHFLSCCGCGG